MLLRALLAQLAGLALAFCVTWQVPGWRHIAIFLVLQGVGAALASRLLRQPPWWVPLHLLFLPAAVLLLQLQWPSWVYLLALAVMALVFWGTVRGDVPLYLSSRTVSQALAELARRQGAERLIDLGAGLGTVVLPLSRQLPALQIEAWEQAPLPWWICRERCRAQQNVRVIRGSFWECDLSVFDVVFAFLSPLAMPRLAEKARREMAPGSLLVSSSFAVPDWEPETVVQLEDARATLLYCYRIPHP